MAMSQVFLGYLLVRGYRSTYVRPRKILFLASKGGDWDKDLS